MSPPSTQPRLNLSLSKKLLFGGLMTALVFGAGELLLWALRVEPAYVREDPYAGFARHIPHFIPAPQTQGSSQDRGNPMLTVAPSKSRVLNPQEFLVNKPADVRRVVCLGGSTTYGRPFFDATSFPGWLRAFLPAVESTCRWEVINAGGISYASYRAIGVMEELAQYSPDLFVVYTGHNEFLERRTYANLGAASSLVTDTVSLVNRTRTATVLRRVLDAARARRVSQIPRGPVLGEETKSIPINAVGPEAYHRDDRLNAEVTAHFRSTLERMIQVAERAKAEIVFVVPGSNLADFAPFKSEHRDGLTTDQLSAWNDHEEKARALAASGQLESALSEIAQAERIDDRFAGLWFLKGKTLQKLGRFNEAKQALTRARDEDICPLRAISPLGSTVREVALKRGRPLVDFEALAEKHSPNGLAGFAMFHDHVHPTVEANRLLALAIIETLTERGVVRPGPSWTPTTKEQIARDVESRIDRSRHAEQLQLLAAMLGWLKQPDAARVQADLSLELTGSSEESLLALSAGFKANGAPELALEYLEKAGLLFSDSSKTQGALGLSYLEAGRLPQAVERLKTALRIDPNQGVLQDRLGVALASSGDWPGAERHLREAVRLLPASGSARNNLGLVAARQGRFEEAVALYEEALGLDPQSSGTHYNAGLALEELGRGAEAKRHYEAAIRLGNGHRDAQARLLRLSASPPSAAP